MYQRRRGSTRTTLGMQQRTPGGTAHSCPLQRPVRCCCFPLGRLCMHPQSSDQAKLATFLGGRQLKASSPLCSSSLAGTRSRWLSQSHWDTRFPGGPCTKRRLMGTQHPALKSTFLLGTGCSSEKWRLPRQ